MMFLGHYKMEDLIIQLFHVGKMEFLYLILRLYRNILFSKQQTRFNSFIWRGITNILKN